MNKCLGSSLFRDSSTWPTMPPWWLLSSPQVAALINVTSATLHVWRVRGLGPPFVPPMFLKPTQGDPVFYQYGALRSWAAQRMGLVLEFEEQVHDFLKETARNIAASHGSLRAKMKIFDDYFARNRTRIRRGVNPSFMSKETMLKIDVFFTRQPKWLVDKSTAFSSE